MSLSPLVHRLWALLLAFGGLLIAFSGLSFQASGRGSAAVAAAVVGLLLLGTGLWLLRRTSED